MTQYLNVFLEVFFPLNAFVVSQLYGRVWRRKLQFRRFHFSIVADAASVGSDASCVVADAASVGSDASSIRHDVQTRMRAASGLCDILR